MVPIMNRKDFGIIVILDFFFFFSYNICIEVLDGLRICFNTFLFRRLLVNEAEQAQYHKALKMTLQSPINNTLQ